MTAQSLLDDIAVVRDCGQDLLNAKHCYTVRGNSLTRKFFVFQVTVLRFINHAGHPSGTVHYRYSSETPATTMSDGVIFETSIGIDLVKDFFTSKEEAEQSLVIYKLTGKFPTLRGSL